jgi:hypothetical protein
VIESEPAAIGVGLVVLGAVTALVMSFSFRTVLPAPAVAALLAGAGAAIGWGGMLLQADPSGPQAGFAIIALALLVPVHVRVVFGPFGPPRGSAGRRRAAGRTER